MTIEFLTLIIEKKRNQEVPPPPFFTKLGYSIDIDYQILAPMSPLV